MHKPRLSRPVSVKPKPKPKSVTVSKNQTDLQKLVQNINQLTADRRYYPLNALNAKELIDVIKEMLYPYWINMTYENLNCLERIDKIRSLFLESETNLVKFVGVSSADQILKRFRLQLSTNRHKADFSIPIVKQCNGVVLEVVEYDEGVKCNILVAPPHDFNPNASKEQLISNAKEYKVYEIQDGTTITIYYDPNYLVSDDVMVEEGGVLKTHKSYSLGHWVKSTKNAFDMDDVIWRGHSYKYILDDVLSQYGELNLEQHKTYTIGFKHPAYHPFGQPKEWDGDSKAPWKKHAWIIQIYDRKLQAVIIEDIGIPHQQQCEFPEIGNQFSDSLQNYVSNHENIFLGCIFRTTSPDLSDVIMESSLWNMIRHSVYQLPFVQNKVLRDRQEQNFKSMQYVIMDAFLDIKKQQMFLHLFPQYSDKYAMFERIQNAVADKIYEDLNKKDALFHVELPQKDREKKIISILASKFTSIVGSQYQPASFQVMKDGSCVSEAVDKKMIKTLISNTRYADIYASVIFL
jgi:hypothetical protein